MLDRRLVLVSGKGGTGKSAVAAALAQLAARRGRTVLLMSMEDRVGLAAHLGVEDLHYAPKEVRPGLHAMHLDRGRALEEYLRLQLGVPRLGPSAIVVRAFDVLASTAPGVREVIAIGKALYESRDTWDLVVVDAAPTGQIGSHLVAPATVGRLLPTGRVLEQAAWMDDLLHDPAHTLLVLTTLAEELPVSETVETLAWIEAEGAVGATEVVANRILPPLGVPDDAIAELPDGPHRSAAVLHRSIETDQSRWLEALPEGPRLPYLFGARTPTEVVARLADALEPVV